MTNEQREAIDRLKQLKCYNRTYYGSMYFKVEVKVNDEIKETIYTVLSLIKEQQEEIEKLKVNLAKSCADRTLDRETLKNQENENLEALHRAYNEEIKKKDKIIDLMARAFKQDDVRTVEEIKQYFASLVEKE